MARMVCLVVFAVFVLPRPAGGQHANLAGIGCEMCHDNHPAISGTTTLRIGASMSPIAGSVTVGALGLSLMSRRCFSCHSTRQLRAEQAGLATLPVQNETLLGLDLSDDHPMGKLDMLTRRRAPLDWRTRMRGGGAVRSLTEPSVEVLDCAYCHDPHDRFSSIPTAEEQREICGDCHEPTVYALGNHSSPTCGDCHEMHGGTRTNLLAEQTLELMCQECHSPFGNVAPMGSSRTMRRYPTIRMDISRRSHTPGARCEECHTIHQPVEPLDD